MEKQSIVSSNRTGGSFARALQKLFRNYLVMIAIIVLVIVSACIQPRILSGVNFINILNQMGALSLLSLGMTIVIIGGFVDLSVVGIINIVCIFTITMIDIVGQVPAIFLGLCFGALLGFINSLIITKCGATTLFEAMFITYGLSSVYSALALIVTDGATQQMFDVVSDTSFISAIGSGSLWIFPMPIVIFVVLLVLMHIFQSKTYTGRAIALVGGNKTAAKLSGISVNKSIAQIFIISGVFAALVSIVLFTRINKASPVQGSGYEMDAVLAVVVGGTTMKGGKGSVIRTLLGVLLITLMSNCMDLLGVSSYWKMTLSGAILVLAIWLDNRKELRGEYK